MEEVNRKLYKILKVYFCIMKVFFSFVLYYFHFGSQR